MNNKKDDLFTDLFAEAMQQVQPIEKTSKITPSTTTVKKKVHRDIHQRTNAATYDSRTLVKSTPQEDGSPWILRANGIAPYTLKKLGNGQLPINRTIDLHGMTRDKSIAALEKTMQSSLQTSDRVICVIHGRGLHSPDGRPILKQSIYQWLKNGPMSAHVLAVTPAPNTAGGSCLILLRRDKHK